VTTRFSPAFEAQDEVRPAPRGLFERELAPRTAERFSPAERPLERPASVVPAVCEVDGPLVRSGS